VECLNTEGGHLVVKIHENTCLDDEKTVLFLKEKDVKSVEKILDATVRKNIKEVVESCKIGQRNRRSQGRPKVSLPKVTDFNEIVTMDLKQFAGVCSFTRFSQGVVLKEKEAGTVVDALNTTWNWRFGFPSVGYWADNGSEFVNKTLTEYF
jgi:pyruvate dehydrogenase complex dehydrogenase (E1) component